MCELEKKINEYLGEDGKLACKDAYKISAQTKTPIVEVGEKAKELGVRISECELGQFGTLKGDGEFCEVAKERLEIGRAHV